jgi:hypothetical protein
MASSSPFELWVAPIILVATPDRKGAADFCEVRTMPFIQYKATCALFGEYRQISLGQNIFGTDNNAEKTADSSKVVYILINSV